MDLDNRTFRIERRMVVLIAMVVVRGVDLSTAQVPAGTATPPIRWAKVTVDMPVSDVAFPAGDGAQSVNASCLMCHSAGMVLRQPPLTQVQWLEEIRKMREFFGAPIPADEDAVLAKYLARINGPRPAQGLPVPGRPTSPTK